MEQQRIGDFIVDAMKAINFRLTSNLSALEDEKETSSYFGPLFMNQVYFYCLNYLSKAS